MVVHFRTPPTWPSPPPGWTPPPGWHPDPAWGPPPPGWQFWTEVPPHPPVAPAHGGRQCRTCGAMGPGPHCARCGTWLEDQPAYLPVVDSFLKLSAIRTYVRTYVRILRSPTRETIDLFRRGDFDAAKRFLELSCALYLVAVAVAGVPLFGDDELVELVAQPLLFLAVFTVSYGLFYWAMRGSAGVRRSRRDFVLFACLTLGFTLPVQIPGFAFGTAGEFLVTLGLVPLYVYLTRAWRWFWAASGARVFWTLVGCVLVGGVAGATLVLVPVWWLTGWPWS